MAQQIFKDEELKLRDMQQVAHSPITKKSQQKTYESLVISKIRSIEKKVESGSLSRYEAIEQEKHLIENFCVYAKVNKLTTTERNDLMKKFGRSIFSLEEDQLKEITTQYDAVSVATPSKYSIFKGTRQKQTQQVKSEINDILSIREKFIGKDRFSVEPELIKLYRQELTAPNPRNSVLRVLRNIYCYDLEGDQELTDVLKANLPSDKKTREGQVLVILDNLNKYEKGALELTKEAQMEMYRQDFAKMDKQQKKSPLGRYYQTKIESLKESIVEEKKRAEAEREERRLETIKKQQEEESIAEAERKRAFKDAQDERRLHADEEARKARIKERKLDERRDFRERESSGLFTSGGAYNLPPNEMGDV